MSVRLYVEGGGDSKSLRTECRRGFREFLEKAGLAGKMPRIVACGGRRDAFDSFCTAAGEPGDRGLPMLLVDAEAPVAAQRTWEHLRVRDAWVPHPGATDDQCHLMVECMESWFLADREALGGYFGKGFRDAILPGNPEVEAIPKAEVLGGIDRATRASAKGGYSKGKHSFAVLAAIDPHRVEGSAPYARRFLEVLRARVGAGE